MHELSLGVSKAFTRESDESNTDEVAPLRPQVSQGAKRYITKEGADRLRKQATALLEERRALVSGGGSRGVDDTARVHRIDAAIQRIQQALDSVIVAEPPTDLSKVGFGALVQVRHQDEQEDTYQIVGPDEAEPGEGRISSVSPLAQALVGSRAGDIVRFNTPVGDQELTVLTVSY